MTVSFGMVATSMRAGKMMIASSSVVGARMILMGNSVRSPADRDYEKISGMLQGKVLTFSQVGQALVDQWLATFADTSEKAHRFNSLEFGGRPVTARVLPRITESQLAHGTRMMARTVETSSLALAPVHQQATENARHLRRVPFFGKPADVLERCAATPTGSGHSMRPLHSLGVTVPVCAAHIDAFGDKPKQVRLR